MRVCWSQFDVDMARRGSAIVIAGGGLYLGAVAGCVWEGQGGGLRGGGRRSGRCRGSVCIPNTYTKTISFQFTRIIPQRSGKGGTYIRRQLRINPKCAISSCGSEVSSADPATTTRQVHCPMCPCVQMKFPNFVSRRPSLSFFSPIVRWIVSPSYKYPYTIRLISSGNCAKNVLCHWKFVRASRSGSGAEVRLIALLRGLSNWFWAGFGGVVEGPALMWKVMRSLGLSLGFVDGVWRASELNLWLRSEERMSEGSQRGVACENTLFNLAFILLPFRITSKSNDSTRAKRCGNQKNVSAV